MGSSSFQVERRKQRIFQVPWLGQISNGIPKGLLSRLLRFLTYMHWTHFFFLSWWQLNISCNMRWWFTFHFHFITYMTFTLIITGTGGCLLLFISLQLGMCLPCFFHYHLLLFFSVSRTCVLRQLFIHAASLCVYAVFHAFTLPFTCFIIYKLVVVRYYTSACSLPSLGIYLVSSRTLALCAQTNS